MKTGELKIVPMRRRHISACNNIVAASEPWKRLGERIHFRFFLIPGRTHTEAHVCLSDDEAVGFVLFIPEPVFARGGYLKAIGVSPLHQGRGIGKKLLSFAEMRTARRAENFFLCVSSFNRRAQAFYQKAGYRKAGSLPGLILPDVAEHIFWKRLRPSPSGKRRP